MKKNLSNYITSRLSDYKKSRITSLFIRISFFSVVISVTVMISSSFLISGFQKELKHRMSVLYGDVVVTESDDLSNPFSQKPLFHFDADTLDMMRKDDELSQVQPYLLNFSMLKNKQAPVGVLFKAARFDSNSAEKEFLIAGRLPRAYRADSLTYEVTISKNIQNQLHTEIGDKILVYYSTANQDILIRKMLVVGIYNSSVYEHDDAVAWSDISYIRDISDIKDNYYHAIGMMARNPKKIEEIREHIWDQYLYNPLKIQTVTERFGYIADWLKLQSTNEYIILVIMFFIALINMISCILILILDRLPMIGTLKALGTKDSSIQNIFLQLSRKIILRGILWGNITAIVLCYIQMKWQIIKLDEEFYMISYVPISFDWQRLIVINVCFFILLSIALIIPTLIIRRMRPVQILKFK